MLDSFLAGAAAGLGVAVPIGAVAVLIIELGLRRGFRLAAAAGAGAATADGFYASLAGIGGEAIAGAIEPFEVPLRILAAAVLVGFALYGLLFTLFWARRTAPGAAQMSPSLARTYVQFLLITIVNPTTVIYFAALVLGLRATGIGPSGTEVFVVGAFVASIAVQWTYAAVGSLGHQRISPRARVALSIGGYLVIIGFAVRIATGLP